MKGPDSPNPKRARGLQLASITPFEVALKRGIDGPSRQVFLRRVEVEGFKTFRDR